jgi:PAS domain S-box-containing protein
MAAKIKKKTKKKGSSEKTPAAPLRRRAEKKLAGGKKEPLPFKGNQQELIHQLQVHQVELEMQNEELRRTQEELTLSQQKYIDLYDFAPAGHFTFDKMGKVVEASLSGARMLGLERAHLLRSAFAEFIAPEYRDVFRVHRQKVLQNGSPRYCELKLIRKDGKSFYAAVRSVGIRDQAGLIRSAFLDITERKEAQERTETEHRFREAIENSLISGIAALDTEWRQTYVNPAFCRMVGWSEEELLGAKPPFVYWPPEQTEDIRKALLPLMAAGNNSGTMEVQFQKRSGERFDALVLYSTLKDARGNIIGWVASVGDITATKQKVREIQNLNRELEERVRQRTAELEKANVLLDSIFESAPIGLGFWNKDLRIMRLNKTLAEIKGLPDRNHVGKKISEVLPDSGLASEMEENWKRILRTGRPMTNIEVSGETFAQRGGRRYWMNNWYPVRVEKEIIGIAAAVVDITERRQIEERIRQNNTVLKGINTIFRATLSSRTEEGLGRICLSVAQEITGSKFAFLGEIGPDGLLHDVAVSETGWEACNVNDKTGHRRPPGNFEIHGLYGRVLTDGKSLITNDPFSHPDSIGVPEGHPPLTAFLGVPLIWDGQTIGMIAVGNREGGYREEDRNALEAVAPVIVESFGRKRAEEALRQNRARLAWVLEKTGVGTWLNELPLGRLGWDEQTRKLFFIAPDAEPTIELFWSCLHPEDREPTRLAIEEAIRDRTSYGIEHRAVNPDTGEVRWIRSMGQAVYAPDGTPTRFDGVNYDITESKQAEEAIRGQAELFRLSFDAIIVWRLDGTIESWNRGAESLYGYTEAEAIGQRTHELFRTVHPVPWPEIEAALNACGHWEGELRHRTKDGREMVVLARHQLIGGTDDIARVLETNRDITDRKRAEEEIQSLNKELARRARELETSNKELDAFVSMVSHDLKNQMAVFGGLIGRLSKRQDKLDDQGRHYLGLLKESVGATFTLVDKLLQFERDGLVDSEEIPGEG